jgi:hypothetical protein
VQVYNVETDRRSAIFEVFDKAGLQPTGQNPDVQLTAAEIGSSKIYVQWTPQRNGRIYTPSKRWSGMVTRRSKDASCLLISRQVVKRNLHSAMINQLSDIVLGSAIVAALGIAGYIIVRPSSSDSEAPPDKKKQKHKPRWGESPPNHFRSIY